MIDCFLGVLPGFCPSSFRVLFCSVVLGCRYTPETSTTGPCSQRCLLFNFSVFECDIAHCRTVVVQCMLYKIRCNPMHPLYGALPVPNVLVRVTHGALVARTSVYLGASSLQNLAVSHDFYSPVCPCGTIMLNTYLMVWD